MPAASAAADEPELEGISFEEARQAAIAAERVEEEARRRLESSRRKRQRGKAQEDPEEALPDDVLETAAQAAEEEAHDEPEPKRPKAAVAPPSSSVIRFDEADSGDGESSDGPAAQQQLTAQENANAFLTAHFFGNRLGRQGQGTARASNRKLGPSRVFSSRKH
jgi:hypothetical protein